MRTAQDKRFSTMKPWSADEERAPQEGTHISPAPDVHPQHRFSMRTFAPVAAPPGGNAPSWLTRMKEPLQSDVTGDVLPDVPLQARAHPWSAQSWSAQSRRGQSRSAPGSEPRPQSKQFSPPVPPLFFYTTILLYYSSLLFYYYSSLLFSLYTTHFLILYSYTVQYSSTVQYS